MTLIPIGLTSSDNEPCVSWPEMAVPQITLTFPAQAEFLRLVRLTSADAGSRVGFDYEEIDDLKIGASEVCSLVLGSEHPITLVFTFGNDCVTIDGSAPFAVPHHDELSSSIISAVLDEYEIVDENDEARFHLVKRHRP